MTGRLNANRGKVTFEAFPTPYSLPETADEKKGTFGAAQNDLKALMSHPDLWVFPNPESLTLSCGDEKTFDAVPKTSKVYVFYLP